MKVSIFTQSFNAGGAEKIAVNLANYYITQKFRVFIFVLINEGKLKQILNKNIRVIQIENSLLKSCISIFKKISIENGDICIFCDRDISLLSIPIRLKAFFLKKKIENIVREANIQTNSDLLNNKFLIFGYKLFVFLLMSLHKNIIANSLDTKKSLLKNSLANKKNIRIIPNPVIDINMINLERKKNFQNLNLRKYDLIFVGRFTSQKNIKMLIDSLNFIEKKKILNIIFLGEGDLESIIQEFITETKHAVSIKSPTHNIAKYFLNSKVLVLPSKYEGFGNVIVEAMFFGLTPVVTDCAGAPKEIIEYGKYGYLSKNLSYISFANKILAALKNPIKKDLLRLRASQFSVDNIAKKYIQEI